MWDHLKKTARALESFDDIMEDFFSFLIEKSRCDL